MFSGQLTTPDRFSYHTGASFSVANYPVIFILFIDRCYSGYFRRFNLGRWLFHIQKQCPMKLRAVGLMEVTIERPNDSCLLSMRTAGTGVPCLLKEP